jgi:hemerythrin superfamily protein
MMNKNSRFGLPPPDAITMLREDHAALSRLFQAFTEIRDDGSDGEKYDIVEKICDALTIHTELEEDIFYPAVRAVIRDADLMDEALVEHAVAKDLILQLQDMDPGDDLYDAKVAVLARQLARHLEDEETEMLPRVRKTKLDTGELGARMLQRKLELMEEFGIAQDDDWDQSVGDDDSARQPAQGSARSH